MVNWTITTFALLTGLTVGSLFSLLEIPIPAPPELPGVMGIIGIYIGFKAIEYLGVGVDAIDALGLS